MTTEVKKKKTPMMEQYEAVRAGLPGNSILLFRLGDFYEVFMEDAEEASRLLGLTLTARHEVPMAGIPYHAAEGYINQLLQKGKKVGICEQVEDASAKKGGGLVKRELVRVLTPGTILEDSQVAEKENHYLMAVDLGKFGVRAAWLDVSTGKFVVGEEGEVGELLPVLHAAQAKEVLVPEMGYKKWGEVYGKESWWEGFEYLLSGMVVTEVADYEFDVDSGGELVKKALGVLNFEGFGIEREHGGIGCGGAIINYLKNTLCEEPRHLRKLEAYRSGEALLLDPATMRNLEVFRNSGGGREGSLIEAMDRTVTAGGGRLLESYLSAPILDEEEIVRRQDCVGDFMEYGGLGQSVRGALKRMRDLGRILGRLQNRIRNPRELGGVRDTLEQLPLVKELLGQMVEGKAVGGLLERIGDFVELRDTLMRALSPTLPGKVVEGGLIKVGYDEELDRLLKLTRENKTWIADLEQREQERTGIKNLKVKFNGSFGYFIEVTKSHLSKVPEDYIRKQTMVNAERFFTEELKAKEKEILGAEDRALQREVYLFQGLVESVLEEREGLEETAHALAEVDLFAGWGELALEWGYCRPGIGEDDALEIEQGRHPVVEQMLKKDMAQTGVGFVANDTWLKGNEEQVGLITGPNMAGKSTYIRQVALIVLMAQVGSWVPAERCHVGLVDRIFSRVGASDELARGNSTFMVEMNETANILNNATDRSLVILDEIGRGTSTYDGLSIAWAVVEHLHGAGVRGPRTLFATHYHELTKLEESLGRLRNYSVSVKEWNDQILFVRQVIPGAADRSYGIQVARLAGLPTGVIDRAKVILSELEAGSPASTSQKVFGVAEAKGTFGATERKKKTVVAEVAEGQMSFL